VTLDASSVGPSKPLGVTIALPNPGMSRVVVTLETERTELKAGIVDAAGLAALELGPAFDTMEKNHALAVDKVISETHATVASGTATASFSSPAKPGTYWVRAVALGDGAGAAGATKFVVTP
jgi:hypothetical protein